MLDKPHGSNIAKGVCEKAGFNIKTRRSASEDHQLRLHKIRILPKYPT